MTVKAPLMRKSKTAGKSWFSWKTCLIIMIAVCAFKPVDLDASGEKPPNIVLIISDDQSWTDYGFMGHPSIQTPCLDKLARQSCLFTRGYVPTSLCRPSLATIITGLYPSQHGITGNDPAFAKGARIGMPF